MKKIKETKKDNVNLGIETILSFDPALGISGFSIIEIDKENKIHVTNHGILDGHKLYMQHPLNIRKKFQHRLLKIVAIRNEINKLIEIYKPTYIATEEPFANPRMISAYVALSLYTTTLEMCAYSKGLPLMRISPREIKKVILDGKATKEQMKENVLKLNINFKNKKKVNNSTEHEIDAIAAGYFLALKLVKIRKDRIDELKTK